MAQPQQQLLSQLRDIRGLEDVSWWPLAPGWWIFLGLIIAIPVGVFLFKKWQAAHALRFKTQLKAMLTDLRCETNVKKKAQGLSEVLRLSALRQYGREACAGLEGREWLAWLKEHDPKGFDWPEEAEILIEAPYMPGDAVSKIDHDFDALFKAAERWVRQ